MLFCFLLLAVTGLVAFFHYVQGFFSATISAIIAAIAAVVAMGYYEQAAPLLFGAKITDSAASLSLVLIFAVAYIIPRLIIDSLVPGNVRVPFIVEKVGAGLMGIMAGLIAAGIVAVAADALPFGPAVGMYTRYATHDQTDAQYGGINGQMQDSKTYDVYNGDKYPDDQSQSSVWLKQDDLVVGLIKRVSADDGSLSNSRPFSTVHPALLDEYYGQRLGIQPGAKHTAVTSSQSSVSVKGIYVCPKPIPEVDGEPSGMRTNGTNPVPTTVAADPTQILLIVRLNLSGKDLGDDTDGLLRFSASSIRLVAGQPAAGIPFKDFYPVATLDNKGIAVACRPDDFLISDMGGSRTIDFVFAVDRDNLVSDAAKTPPFQLPAGTFVDFKRYAVCDISGQTVEYGPPPTPDKTPLMRKPSVQTVLDKTDGIWTGAGASDLSAPPLAAGGNPQAAGGETSAGGAAANTKSLGDSGLGYIDISISNKLPYPINAGTSNDAATVQLPSGVGGELAHRQWTTLTVTPDTTLDQLTVPPSEDVQELAVDPNTVLVQVQCAAPVSGSANQMWAWGNRLADFALADATGQTFPCVGVWATAQRGTDHFLVVNYKNFDDKNHLQPLTSKKGRPVNVWLAFQVPAGTPIAEIRFSAQTAVDNLNFKAQ